MRTIDTLSFAGSSLRSNRLRSFLTGLGIAIGIAAVVLLTSIGEGVQRYIVSEFTQFGTNLIVVVPGKTSTHGFSGAGISNVRPLTIDDELALRHLSGILDTVSVVQSNAKVEAGRLQRRTTVPGTGHGAPEVWQFKVASGRFLRQVLTIFLLEAVTLAAVGGVARLILGHGTSRLLQSTPAGPPHPYHLEVCPAGRTPLRGHRTGRRHSAGPACRPSRSHRGPAHGVNVLKNVTA